MDLSIIIPCYNEAKNIPLLLQRFQNIVQNTSTEIILVNNGSKDNTEELLSQLQPSYPFLRVVKVPVNQGYGFGILSGLKEARGNFLGWTHADLQTDPNDLFMALKLIKGNNGPPDFYIKGRRCNRPLQDIFFTYGMTLLEKIYLGEWMWDINAQPNIFHQSFFRTWQNPPHDFSLDLYAFYMAKKQNLHIIRFNVKFPPRIHGQSSWNTGIQSKLKFIKRTLDFSWELKKNLKQTGV